ncbi:hypothetical protein BOTBODRAFT_65452 [Botryobasidium botryosum FD-172 SS1]|uniref:Uncharacterized protein n=1 Tax=Botryobasidium botryosum (strain FD-172 SS1) TaxID=930990 RepID=A0A067MKZ4_BOTB1|nr:hypothetical protein BOTBODRAFT_65452 [Botryobasidium botryosum FD-172 SS1]
MTLETGEYTIQYLKTRQYIGRKFAEDKSLNPKQVVSVPQDAQAPKWRVEKLDNDRYRLSIGYPTGVQGRGMAAFLMGEEPEEWVIRHFGSGEDNVYSIQGGGGHCKIFEDEPETRVSIALTRDVPDPWIFNRA